MKGAVRATPRTVLTQPHTSQPRKADTNTAHSVPAQVAAPTAAHGTARPAGALTSSTGALPSRTA